MVGSTTGRTGADPQAHTSGSAMESTDNRRVLIVDDQQDIHDDFDEMLGASDDSSLTDELASLFVDEQQDDLPLDFELLHANSGEEALGVVTRAIADTAPIAVAYVDIRMPPGIDGIETVRRIRRIDREMEIIVMTAYTDKRLADIVRNMEVLDKLIYVRKPFAREEVQLITLSLAVKWNLAQKLSASSSQTQQLRMELQRLRAQLAVQNPNA